MQLVGTHHTVTFPERYKISEGNIALIAKNISLGGTLTVDSFAKRKRWVISFAYLTCDQYDEIKQIYEDQIQHGDVLSFTESTYLGVSSLSVFMSIPDESQLRFSPFHVQGFSMIIEPTLSDVVAGVS